VLYGNRKRLFGVEKLLHFIAEVKTVFAFESFSLVRDHLIRDDVDMIFLDADDDITDWSYLVQKFREINPRTRIVLLSGSSDQSVRAYEAGVFDYLLKPVKKSQMERVVSKEWR
jgi:two-component SAPR family response regulator